MNPARPGLLLLLALSLQACATAPSTLSQEELLQRLNQRLNASTPDMTDCFRRELGLRAEQVNGRLVLRFEIDGDGFIRDLEIVENEVQDPQAELCVADTIRRLYFEEQLGRPPVRLTKPFSFFAGR